MIIKFLIHIPTSVINYILLIYFLLIKMRNKEISNLFVNLNLLFYVCKVKKKKKKSKNLIIKIITST